MSATTPLKRLSAMAGQKGLSDLHIPTITDQAEDVAGLQGRIRLQRNDNVKNSQWMDKQRNTLLAYEYLCHIGEAKEWIEECISEVIDPITKLEESMRDGIVLAKLACWFAPGVVHKNKIITDTKHKFLHSENINAFFKAIQTVGLPKIFMFELTDLYDKKNIPKVIFCIHALSHLLAGKNMAPNIKNLLGELHFTNEELSETQRTLDSYGVAMPNFSSIDSSLREELGGPRESSIYRKTGSVPIAPNFSAYVATPEAILEIEDSDTESTGSLHESPLRIERSSRHPGYWEEPENLSKLKTCQEITRGWISRREFKRVQQVHRSTTFQSSVRHLQAYARGVLARRDMDEKRIIYDTTPESWVIQLQSACRGFLARDKMNCAMEYYADKVDEITHVQGVLKNKITETSYRKLVTEANPSLGTVKNFIHLLDDSDLDFDQELKIEDRRKQVIELIRYNNQLDVDLNVVDTKIALLVRNAIKIDEVLKVSSVFGKKELRRISHLTTVSSSGQQALTLRGIDKESRTKLDLYQQLVYLLQTEPHYLARLMSLASAGGREGRGSTHRRLESAVLVIFGYATNVREEYLLINLCKYCISEEIQYVASIQEFMRGNYMFLKLVVQTNRGAKEREFFRRLLKPLIEEVVRNEFLDLETDPVRIYRQCINDEELRTGRPSLRKHAVTSEEALADLEVRDAFVMHLRNLREITERFLSAVTSTVDEVPYGIRVIARELRLALKERFPEEPSENISKMLGHFIYYRYLNPAIIAPDQHDVITESISAVQRRNLAEISKMLQQISSGKVFDETDIFLAPLNNYVFEAGRRFSEWFITLTDVEEPQDYFGMDALADHARTQKPAVYISLHELYHLHHVIETYADELEPEQHGTLHSILNELGLSPYRRGVDVPEQTLCLNLSSRGDDLPRDADARLQQLLVDTKRLVVYVVRVQSGPTIREIIDTPSNQEHEELWSQLKMDQFVNAQPSIADKRKYLTLGQRGEPLDLNTINFVQLKKIADRLLRHLEQCNILDYCQDIIRQIAQDIVGKKDRRQKREKELVKLDATLANLEEKRQYLERQREEYNDYLKTCMNTMASKHSKKNRFIMPFTRQYFHVRRLEKQGLVPRFGSYRYTAKQLHERGVVLELNGVDKRFYDSIPVVISMDQPGIISFEVKWLGNTVRMDMTYEELLQTQFDGVQTFPLLDGMAKVHVNLLIYLINKKFYSS